MHSHKEVVSSENVISVGPSQDAFKIYYGITGKLIRWKLYFVYTKGVFLGWIIIRNCDPELVSGSMGCRKSEMLKKFQHDMDIVNILILITDYDGVKGLTFSVICPLMSMRRGFAGDPRWIGLKNQNLFFDLLCWQI